VKKTIRSIPAARRDAGVLEDNQAPGELRECARSDDFLFDQKIFLKKMLTEAGKVRAEDFS